MSYVISQNGTYAMHNGKYAVADLNPVVSITSINTIPNGLTNNKIYVTFNYSSSGITSKTVQWIVAETDDYDSPIASGSNVILFTPGNNSVTIDSFALRYSTNSHYVGLKVGSGDWSFSNYFSRVTFTVTVINVSSPQYIGTNFDPALSFTAVSDSSINPMNIRWDLMSGLNFALSKANGSQDFNIKNGTDTYTFDNILIPDVSIAAYKIKLQGEPSTAYSNEFNITEAV